MAAVMRGRYTRVIDEAKLFLQMHQRIDRYEKWAVSIVDLKMPRGFPHGIVKCFSP
ncbi:hypothetical protein PAFU01_07900 [Pantoea ananatis]|nr:hypothetical protein PAFU01_07900 [Pantoea ananatis]